MKKRLIVISAFVAVITLVTYGFKKPIPKTCSDTNNKTNSEHINLSYFGINGGIGINNNTGKSSQFVANDMELAYRVYGNHLRYRNQNFITRSITKEKLQNANTLADIITDFPSNWIRAYNSVVITISTNGKEKTVTGYSKNLTKEQKDLFKLIDIESGVNIMVSYKKETHNESEVDRQMNVSLVVIPEKEATYNGGYEQLIRYIKDGSLKEIRAKKFKHLPQPTISFTVNKNGSADNVKLVQSSRDEEIDNLLLELIKTMPKWQPAKNAKGETVNQNFVLEIGQDGC